jgi:flavodoxin
MRVLILYESRRGFTMQVAHAIRDEIRRRGELATCAALGTVDAGTIAAADALVIGTWIEGMILFRVRPADGAMRGVHALPDLGGRPAAVFCTFDVHPFDSLDRLANRLAARGARVLVAWRFKRYHRKKVRRLAAVPAFVERCLEAFAAAPAAS